MFVGSILWSYWQTVSYFDDKNGKEGLWVDSDEKVKERAAVTIVKYSTDLEST